MPSDKTDWFRLELYPFSYFDAIRNRWVKARYVATLEDIRASHERHRIEGPPEIREGPRDPRILTPRSPERGEIPGKTAESDS